MGRTPLNPPPAFCSRYWISGARIPQKPHCLSAKIWLVVNSRTYQPEYYSRRGSSNGGVACATKPLQKRLVPPADEAIGRFVAASHAGRPVQRCPDVRQKVERLLSRSQITVPFRGIYLLHGINLHHLSLNPGIPVFVLYGLFYKIRCNRPETGPFWQSNASSLFFRSRLVTVIV